MYLFFGFLFNLVIVVCNVCIYRCQCFIFLVQCFILLVQFCILLVIFTSKFLKKGVDVSVNGFDGVVMVSVIGF